ncbi:MAG: hydroxymethylglutaryl-CoA synthase family protein [Promethearchaeota archaeon]
MISDDFLFSNIGIDSFGFYAPRCYISLDELAEKRNVDPDKYKKGLLLKEMRIPEYGEDIISMGVKAGYNAILRGNINPKTIDAVFVGTETMTYAVKSVSNIFAQLLGISTNSMTQDIYNACAGGTLALINAISLIKNSIIKKALVISSDISTYDLRSPSEATQGSGAIAFIITKNPRIARFSNKFGKVSGNVNDFFRPANQECAQVFGKYSVETYIEFQLNAYDDLVSQVGDFHADHYVFHAPFAKMPIKIMQQIILKRWIRHINYLPKLRKKKDGTSLLKKLDNFLHDVTVLPEWLYLKLKERGRNSGTFEQLSRWFITNVKQRILPQLRVPSHFGNMYNASIWAQIIYILENLAQADKTIYFGSYGSGATCISGLMKISPKFANYVRKRPHIDDYIDNKKQISVKDYEMIRNGVLKPLFYVGKIYPHKDNNNRGFVYHICDKGCIIPNIRGLDHCPKGHSGFHEHFFPLYATLETTPKLFNAKDLSFLNDNLVQVDPMSKKGNSLEYHIRRVHFNNFEMFEASGLLDWAPLYIPIQQLF